MGLEKTVTRGIVSATGRRLLQVGEVFQLDAAVNQGNSGGPAVDLDGRLAGLIFAGVPYFQGLNFALPADRVRRALPALLEGGEVKRPWLGMALAESARGLECVYVLPESPAASLAMDEGSFIRTLAGTDFEGVGEIARAQEAIFYYQPGELVRLVDAEGDFRIFSLEARPKLPLLKVLEIDTKERALIPLMGLVLNWLRSGLFNTEYNVTRVIYGSLAEEAGISELDSLAIQSYKWDEKRGYALVDLRVKRRKAGYIETVLRIPIPLASSDFL